MQHINTIEKRLSLDNFKDLQPIKILNQKTNVHHRHITLTLLIVLFTVLTLFRPGQNLLLLILGFVYPFFKSFKDLRAKNKDNRQKWMVYWMFFGLIFGFSFLSSFFFNILPFGRVVLSIILFSIYSSQIKGYKYLKKYVLANTLGKIPEEY